MIRPDGTGRRNLGEGAQPAWSPDGKQIAFDREAEDSGFDHQLFVMNADGTGQRRLLTDGCDDVRPAWSAADEIAFLSICSDPSSRYGISSRTDAVRPDGSGRRTIVRDGGSLAWSPDGKRLAIAGDNIDVVNADGSGRHALLTRPGGDAEPAWSKDGKLAFNGRAGVLSTLRNGKVVELGYGDSPSWAPDGRRLVADDMGGNLNVVDVITKKQTTILEHTGAGDPEKGSPDWSPDGAAILFTAVDDSTIGIFDVRRMEEGELRVGVAGILPAWSPDGRGFAYTRASIDIDSGGNGISVARADGSGQRRLTRTGYHPTWSPDGRQIAFVRDVTPTNPEIFVINADGTGERRLTHNPGYDGDPAWSRG